MLSWHAWSPENHEDLTSLSDLMGAKSWAQTGQLTELADRHSYSAPHEVSRRSQSVRMQAKQASEEELGKLQLTAISGRHKVGMSAQKGKFRGLYDGLEEFKRLASVMIWSDV